MAELKVTTLAEDVSDPFAPTGEFRLQVTSSPSLPSDIPNLVIDVEASVETAGDYWSPIHSWRLTEGAIKRFAEQTRVRVRIRGNKPGNTVTVRWS